MEKNGVWILPYKQIVLESGLLVLFEQTVETKLGEAPPFQLVRKGNAFLLQVGEYHLVPLDVIVLDCIVMTRRLYFGVSEKTDISGVVMGILDIDEMSIGKIVAHQEAAYMTMTAKEKAASLKEDGL
jgi:hypothetical protein